MQRISLFVYSGCKPGKIAIVMALKGVFYEKNI